MLAIAAGTVTVLFVTAALTLRTDALRPRVVNALADALNCDVTLDALEVRLVPTIRVTGTNLTIRLRNRPELPPFAEASSFTVRLGLLSMLRRHIDVVDVDGLHMNVPKKFAEAIGGNAGKPASPLRSSLFTVNHLVTHDGTLNFVGREPNNRPLRFAIHDFDIAEPSVEHAMRFTAHVTNPFPSGVVTTSGTFGPWSRDDPTQTPLAGMFDLADGDLSSIAGISGHVASTGTFTGQLTEIHVNGSSRTENFSLELGGSPVAITTTFDVTIDGSDGTTVLDRVDAVLIKTPLHFTGVISNAPTPGHDVALTVEVHEGRIEDILPLVIKTDRPILIGRVSSKSRLWLPPGPATTVQRLHVDGTFDVRAARFTDALMQTTLRELSQRAKAKDQDKDNQPIDVDVAGALTLQNGVVRLPGVAAKVPGARFDLSGTYLIGPETLNFRGTARLEASMSKVVGGFKSIFIKPFNRLFSENGSGAIIPIAITGTRQMPEFGVRKADIFKKGK